MTFIKASWNEPCNTSFAKKFHLTLPESKHLTIVAVDYDIASYDICLFRRFGIHLPGTIENSVLKRQAEYLAGRYVARRAMSNLDTNVISIPSGRHRNPIWPEGIVASITHTDTKAVCIASYKKEYKYLGIDLERKLESKCIFDIKNIIINKQEEDLLATSRICFEDAFSLVFSAKESLFKALYHNVKDYFDFSAAQVTAIFFSERQFQITLLENLSNELTKSTKFTGYFTFYEGHVLTIIAQ